MGGARIAVYALLLLVVLVLVEWGFQHSGNATSADANQVYCLAPSNQGGLVHAAVSLGVAAPGSTPRAVSVSGRKLTLMQWRAADDSGFHRSCDAYAAAFEPAAPAQGKQDSGIQQLLTILLPVMVGAFLTLAADDAKQASDRRWTQAGELRADWNAYQSAVESYVRRRQDTARSGEPSAADVEASRRALRATLLKIQSQHRKSPTIVGLQQDLDGDLGPAIANGWGKGDNGSDPASRNQRANEIRGCLETFGSSLQKVAGALERRIWLSSKL